MKFVSRSPDSKVRITLPLRRPLASSSKATLANVQINPPRPSEITRVGKQLDLNSTRANVLSTIPNGAAWSGTRKTPRRKTQSKEPGVLGKGESPFRRRTTATLSLRILLAPISIDVCEQT